MFDFSISQVLSDAWFVLGGFGGMFELVAIMMGGGMLLSVALKALNVRRNREKEVEK